MTTRYESNPGAHGAGPSLGAHVPLLWVTGRDQRGAERIVSTRLSAREIVKQLAEAGWRDVIVEAHVIVGGITSDGVQYGTDIVPDDILPPTIPV